MHHQPAPQGPVLPPGFENYHTLDKPARDRLVGDFIFPKIKNRHGDQLAGKLTGMILGLDPNELFQLVQNEAKLIERSEEALKVLE
jgi:hypothetical protein